MKRAEKIQAEFEYWILNKKERKMENQNVNIEQKLLKMESEVRILANEMKEIHDLLKDLKPILENKMQKGESFIETDEEKYDVKTLHEEVKALDKKLSDMFDVLYSNTKDSDKNDQIIYDEIIKTYNSLFDLIDRATGTIKRHTTNEISRATQSINTTTAMERNRWN